MADDKPSFWSFALSLVAVFFLAAVGLAAIVLAFMWALAKVRESAGA